MSLATRAKFDPLRKLEYSSITGTYHSVGSTLKHPALCIWINNTTDRMLTFSIDGINDHLELPSLGYFFWDISANKSQSPSLSLSVGDGLYVRTETTNPTQGRVTFAVMYGFEN
jgi:hypothetical protein